MDPIEDMSEKEISPTGSAEPLFMMTRVWFLELLYHALALAAILMLINSVDPNAGYSQSSRDEQG